MPTKPAVLQLEATQAKLLSAFGDLERLGVSTAAAHVAAALEDLGGRVGNAPASAAALVDDDQISRFSKQMRREFGDRAEPVARRQLHTASGASLTVWAAIVNHLVGQDAF